MAKAGMIRSSAKEMKDVKGHSQKISKNDVPPVPEIQGKAKSSNKKILDKD